MPIFTVKEILEATGGRLIRGEDSAVVQGVSIDTRTIRPSELFIAVPGPNFDGHDFIAQAVEKSAAAIIICKKSFSVKPQIPVILVPDPVQALGRIAQYHRRRFPVEIIAVTGSAGKTTTKEMIASVLEAKYRVLKNTATENNHIGVPLTPLKLDFSHQVAVIEFGTNRFGDIRWLTAITHPTAVLFTNIGESHLEFLKTPAGVLSASKCDSPILVKMAMSG